VCHTIVPEYYKDDVESQWNNLKFDSHHPKTSEPMATKIGRGDGLHVKTSATGE